jgi:hypothetical protein
MLQHFFLTGKLSDAPDLYRVNSLPDVEPDDTE